MAMTMTQKILAAHSGNKSVKTGQFIEADLDVVLANDITGPVAIKEFAKMGAKEVFDKMKVVLVPDHFTPNKDIKAAEQCKMLREFADKQEIENYFEVGSGARLRAALRRAVGRDRGGRAGAGGHRRRAPPPGRRRGDGPVHRRGAPLLAHPAGRPPARGGEPLGRPGGRHDGEPELLGRLPPAL